MWGGTEQIKTEAPKTETPEAKATREAQEFTGNLTKVTEAVKAPETADKIITVLDSNFQKWLITLAKTEEGKKQLTALKDLAEQAQKDVATTLDANDKAALTSLLALLTPLTATYTAEVTTHTDEFTSAIVQVETNKTKFDSYNTKSDNLTKAKEKIKLDDYKDLPWQKLIATALDNPTISNIKELQSFLYDKVSDAMIKAALKTSSINTKTNERDGRLGAGTFAAFDKYLTTFAGEVTQAKADAQTALDTKKAEDLTKSDAVVKTTEEVKTKTETALDENKSLAIINSKITYEHPERADKTIKPVDKNWDISYRGEKINMADLLTKPVDKKATIWLSFVGPVIPTIDTDKQTAWEAKVDAQIDAKVMTYDAKTNNYVYGGKYISRDAIGTGTDKMTLETFQTEVDKMNMNTTNEYRTNATRTSADGNVITKIKDFDYENGYKIKTTTLDNTTKNVATTKVEVKRGDKEKTVTKTFDAAGRTDTFTKVKTNGDVKKEKTRTFDDEGSVVDFSKTKEDKDSFKEKATTKELAIDTKTTDVIPASAADISKALNDISKKTPLTLPMPINDVPITVNVPTNSLFNNYDIKNSGEKINISLKKEWTPLSQKDFDTMFKTLLTDAGITKLAMKEYNEQGSKTETDNVTTKSVTERSFTVSEGTSQNKPASQKIMAGGENLVTPNALA